VKRCPTPCRAPIRDRGPALYETEDFAGPTPRASSAAGERLRKTSTRRGAEGSTRVTEVVHGRGPTNPALRVRCVARPWQVCRVAELGG